MTGDEPTPADVAAYQVQIGCWNPENWLSYHGDQTGRLGELMGPNLFGQPCTVVGTHHDPEHEWPDGRRGITLLGLVTGDVRAELGAEVLSQHGNTTVVLVGHREAVSR